MPISNGKFRNRPSAGDLIASQIAIGRPDETVVVAIPHGGVPVAAPISRRFGVPVKVCLIARVTLPENPDLSVGTMSYSGDILLDSGLLQFQAASDWGLTKALQTSRTKLRGLSNSFAEWTLDASLTGKHVILVDDVIATGNTAVGAVQYLQQFKPRSVSVTTPVVSRYAGLSLSERQINYEAMVVGSQGEFAPRDYYADFDEVDGNACLSILASISCERRSSSWWERSHGAGPDDR